MHLMIIDSFLFLQSLICNLRIILIFLFGSMCIYFSRNASELFFSDVLLLSLIGETVKDHKKDADYPNYSNKSCSKISGKCCRDNSVVEEDDSFVHLPWIGQEISMVSNYMFLDGANLYAYAE